MEFRATNLILALLGVVSIVWAVFSEEQRIIAIVIAFILLMVIILSEQNYKIDSIYNEQNRIEEKLKIHEQLINIKADIELLKRKK